MTQREEMSVGKRIKDNLNRVPGDRMDLKGMPEKHLREYFDEVITNAVGNGGIIKIRENPPDGDRDSHDLWVGYDWEKEEGVTVEPGNGLLPEDERNILHEELKSFLKRHPGTWKILDKNGMIRKNEYQFTVQYDKARDEVVQTHEETLEDRAHYNDLMDNPF